MASQQYREVESPDYAGYKHNLASQRNSMLFSQTKCRSSHDDLELHRSTACNSRPMTRSLLRSEPDFT